jgi:hypothetical protein
MGKRISEKLSFSWYILSFGIVLVGLDNLFTLISFAGYVDINSIYLLSGLTDFLGSILLLAGLTLVLFKLISTYELKTLEGRKKDIDFLLSSLEGKSSDGLSKEVINNLKKELIDIEKKIEELK